MKTTSRSLYSKIAAIAVVLSFGLCAYAQAGGPREELAHAYYLLKAAKADYGGHRHKALDEVEAAGRGLGIELKGGVEERERQWESDKQIEEARRLLADVRDRMEAQDRDRIAHHLDEAIKEVNAALRKR
jgi:hypothetical protein